MRLGVGSHGFEFAGHLTESELEAALSGAPILAVGALESQTVDRQDTAAKVNTDMIIEPNLPVQ